MFKLKNVSKRFSDEYALHDISMDVNRGLNFIIGASGSGKTTLLKIISGMEPAFDGDVFFCGQNIKELSEKDRSYFYNNVFGFVWQDFNLLDDRTVLENVLLPQYLKKSVDEKTAMKVLRELKISELKDQRVAKLSGGQKQRVAIARELMKNPQVILADEPTSALDEKSAKNTIEILRELSKKRTVIIVTHDTSLIDSHAKVYELDKGELIARPDLPGEKESRLPQKRTHTLSFGNAFSLGKTALLRNLGRSATSGISLLVAATLLLVTASGAIGGSSQGAFDELFATYGDSLLDITVADSFVSAGGTNGESQDGPNADVDQDIDGLFERYREDERVSHVLFGQPFGNIKVKVDGKEYTVENSNNVPVMNRLVTGSLPMGDEKEVAVPESFVKALGVTNEQAIGKKIDFSGTVFNWESGQPIETPMGTTVKIVGVIDTTMVTEYGGQTYEFSIDDSFFFSPAALSAMREGAGMKAEPGIFYIRTKTPADLISIKDELNASGIVPLGRFELVEDMVRLNAQTTQQSGSAMFVIGLLSLVLTFAVAALNAALRRREFAVYQVSGFGRTQLATALAGEFILLICGAGVLFLTLSPILNIAICALWSVNILNAKLLSAGVLLTACMGTLSYAVTTAVAFTTKAVSVLKTGDK